LPTDERITLTQIPERKVASLQYSGSWQQAKFDANVELLRQWLRQQQLRFDSLPRIAGYDPPWTLPFLRRNEVLIDIKP
jgi:DNA gyrase inhibitor GyrI